MIEIYGDYWDFARKFDKKFAMSVTTNGIVDKYGNLVMGGGIALQFRHKFPFLPKSLAMVKTVGNVPIFISNKDPNFPNSVGIINLPTKEHYSLPSTEKIVSNSLDRLDSLLDELNIPYVLTVRPGCGLGMLLWADVKKMMETKKHERYIVIHTSIPPE